MKKVVIFKRMFIPVWILRMHRIHEVALNRMALSLLASWRHNAACANTSNNRLADCFSIIDFLVRFVCCVQYSPSTQHLRNTRTRLTCTSGEPQRAFEGRVRERVRYCYIHNTPREHRTATNVLCPYAPSTYRKCPTRHASTSMSRDISGGCVDDLQFLIEIDLVFWYARAPVRYVLVWSSCATKPKPSTILKPSDPRQQQQRSGYMKGGRAKNGTNKNGRQACARLCAQIFRI